MTNSFYGWPLMAVALVLLSGTAFAQREVSFVPDQFGYQLRDDNQCPQQWIDISATGTALELTAASEETASDDGGVQVDLPQGVEFYGRWYESLVVSSNGYLTFAESLAEENGGDFSNDCSLPAVPDNSASRFGRVAAFHDDLESGSNGQMYFQHFATCPRTGVLVGEACSVVLWHQWGLHNAPEEALSFEIVLYPASREIVVQYEDVNAMPGLSATAGLQAANLRSALNVACNQSNALPEQGAWCAAFPAPIESIHGNGFEAP